jgi:hypothetical protein
MGLEVVVEFAPRENYRIEQLLDLWVALLVLDKTSLM